MICKFLKKLLKKEKPPVGVVGDDVKKLEKETEDAFEEADRVFAEMEKIFAKYEGNH